MAFNLDNYVDVPTRLLEALKKWPDLRIQETSNEIVTMPDGSYFYRCTVSVWRDEKDPLPAIATAAEPYPGKTPYTKNAEFMVGMTSALGRALGYMGCGSAKSIASRNEVEARLDQPTPVQTQRYASAKSVAYLKSLARGHEYDDQGTLAYVHHILGVDDVILETLTQDQATRVIEALKNNE
jgi:hypothetical protein